MPTPSEHAEYPRPSQASLLRRTLRWAALGYCLAAAGESSATAMRYRHNAPESPLDQRYEYQWAVLRRALEITAPQYGPYVLEPGRLMNEQRQVHEMQQGTGALSVIYLDTSPTLEATLSPVRIPVDKGVVGFRVLLIRKEQLAKFHRDFTVRDLAGMRFGAGAGWVDVDILRANGLQVVTGSNYDGLFAMLEHGRFDAFPRGANEILGEFNAQGSRFPSLAIEEHLLIQYPQPMYFWFSRSAEGRRLGERAEAGLRRMLDDGTFDALFHQYHQNAIEALRLHQRRIIRLTNPLLGPDTPLQDRRLWFDPQAAAPPTP